MKKYVKFIKNNRKSLYIILFISIILAGIGIRRIDIDTDFTLFMPGTSEYKEILDEMNETFTTSEQMTILLENERTSLSIPLLQDYRDLQKFLADLNNVEFINGPTPEQLNIGRNQINFDHLQENDLNQIKEYYTGLGNLAPVTYHEGKTYGTFTIFPDENFGINEINQIESFLEDKQLTYYLTGDVYMQQKIIDYVTSILLFIPPLAILLLTLVFKSQMGSFKSTFIALLPAIIGAQWTMGLIGWSGQEVSIVSVLAPIFTVVIGSADGLHFVSHVQDARTEGKNKIESIVHTLSIVGKPIIITTLTSMIGFLSLLIMDTAAINDLATFAALGIFLAGVITWLVLPLILTGKTRLNQPEVTYGRKLSEFIKKLWGKPAITILILLLIISAYGTANLNTEFNMLMIYREFTEVFRSHQKIMDVNEGATPVFAYFKTEQDPLHPEVARTILDFQNDLVAGKNTVNTVSPYNFISRIYSINRNLEQPVFPEQQIAVEFIYSMISEREETPIHNLLNREKGKIRFTIFPHDLKNETLAGIEKKVQEFNNNHPDIEAAVTGAQYLMKDLNLMMIENQRHTLYLAFMLIFIMLFISLKKIKSSIIALLPILFTVIFLLGFLGISGISLNVITATIFSITIGVGIDYAVHYTSVWQYYKNKGLNSSEAVAKAYNYTSRPILANAFGLAIGLSALLFSPIRLHLYVSILMWVAMMSGVFFSLSFLPTVLNKLR